MLTAQFIIECGLVAGLGHLRRSLVLACSLRDRGVECSITISSDVGVELAEQYGFSSQSSSLETILATDLIIFDGNSFTEKQIKDWSAHTKYLCIIDDNGLRPIECDILINPNLYAKTVSYNQYQASRFLLGPDYHLIADNFFSNSSEAVRSIDYLISFGGSDDGKLALPVIEKLIKNSHQTIVWAVPSYIEPGSYIIDLVLRHENFSIVIDGDIPTLFSQTKCFIGGAGAMVLEALASGCEVIACAVVADQGRNIEYLREHNIPAFSQFDVDKIIHAAQRSHGPNTALIDLDANGAAKIADVILMELNK